MTTEIELDNFMGRDDLTADDIATIRKLCEELIDDSTPGRYEGASIFTPWFDMLGGNGFADYGDCDCREDDDAEDDFECAECCASHDWIFNVSDTDRRIFPELKDANRVTIPCDSQGFVDAIAE